MKNIPFHLVVIISVTFLLLTSCKKQDVGKSGIVKDHFFLRNGDAKMPVYVEGNISSGKILVIVHGGPGDGSLYYNTKEATGIGEKEVAIAYWDQRLSGLTQGNYSSTNLNAYLSDIRKLIQLLKNLYGESQKIYLLGHSWGGLLTPLFLLQEDGQALVNGWIQVGGIHNYVLGDSLSRRDLIRFGQEEISAGRHVDDWRTIVDYCRHHEPAGNYNVARKINAYANETDELISAVAPAKATKELIKYFIREYQYPITTFISNGIYNHVIGKMEKQAYAQNVSSRLGEIRIPTLLLWGEYDFVAPVDLSSDIEQKVASLDVSKKIFQHSGHSPMMNEPILFWTIVKDWLLIH